MKTYLSMKLEDTYLNREKKYDNNEVYKTILKELSGNSIAADAFMNKYLLMDNEGIARESSIKDTYRRVAHALASVEDKNQAEYWEDIFYSYIVDTKIMPQGSVMSGAGNNFQLVSLSNCFVGTPPRDSIDGINESIGDMSNCQKRRGGWGTDLGLLRPHGAVVKNAAKTSTGAWGWANSFSNRTREIAQGGRRGALMLTYPIDGMDSFSWATMKSDLTYCTGANVSFRVFDAFMEAVINDTDWELKFEPLKLSRMVRARDLFSTICNANAKGGEPGLLFWDNITNNLPLDKYPGFKTVSTNPCAELPQAINDSCRLITINLTKFLKPITSDSGKIGTYVFDFEAFKEAVTIAMRMLDNLVELESLHTSTIANRCGEPAEEKMWLDITYKAQQGRRTGLGNHGLADMLTLSNYRFADGDNFEEQKDYVDKIYFHFKFYAYSASVELAKERGTFPMFNWETEKGCHFFKIDKWQYNGITKEEKKMVKELFETMQTIGRRNGALLTIAPTGTISQISELYNYGLYSVSSGIEPPFMLSYVRRRKINQNDLNQEYDYVDVVGDKWQEYFVLHPLVRQYIIENKPELIEEIVALEQSFRNWGKQDDNPEQIQENRIAEISKVEAKINKLVGDLFITSAQCNWKNRIVLQGIIQKHIDHGVSSTINLPNSILGQNEDGTINYDNATNIVIEFYIEAWKNGLKGQTVYIDGSRSGVLVSSSSYKKQNDSKLQNAKIRPTGLFKTDSPIRPKNLPCDIHQMKINGEPWVVIVGLLDGQPYEVFSAKNIHNFELPSTGILHKVKSQKYELRIAEYYKINGEKVHHTSEGTNKSYLSLSIDEYFTSNSETAYTYLISKAIQHGTPIWAIIDMANKMPGSIVGFNKSITRVLKKYIEKETKLKCSECGSTNLIFEENCFRCLDCNSSKCS